MVSRSWDITVIIPHSLFVLCTQCSFAPASPTPFTKFILEYKHKKGYQYQGVRRGVEEVNIRNKINHLTLLSVQVLKYL